MIGRRVVGLGLGIAGCASLALVWYGRVWDALVLTVTTSVGIINTLWLEGALLTVLQPGKPRVSRGAAAIFAGRFALWALLFAALFVVRDRVNLWAVAAGIACYLLAVGVVGAGERIDNPREE